MPECPRCNPVINRDAPLKVFPHVLASKLTVRIRVVGHDTFVAKPCKDLVLDCEYSRYLIDVPSAKLV